MTIFLISLNSVIKDFAGPMKRNALSQGFETVSGHQK